MGKCVGVRIGGLHSPIIIVCNGAFFLTNTLKCGYRGWEDGVCLVLKFSAKCNQHICGRMKKYRWDFNDAIKRPADWWMCRVFNLSQFYWSTLSIFVIIYSCFLYHLLMSAVKMCCNEVKRWKLQHDLKDNYFIMGNTKQGCAKLRYTKVSKESHAACEQDLTAAPRSLLFLNLLIWSVFRKRPISRFTPAQHCPLDNTLTLYQASDVLTQTREVD